MKKYIFLIAVICLLLLNGCKNDNISTSSSSQKEISEGVSVIPENSQAAESADDEVSEQMPSENSEKSEKAEIEEILNPSETVPSETAEKTWWQEGLSQEKLIYPSAPNMPSCGNPYSYIYFYDNDLKFSLNMFGAVFSLKDQWLDMEAILKYGKESKDLGEEILSRYFMEIVALDDTKYTINFYEKGILLTESLPKEDKGKTVKIEIDKEIYKNLLVKIDELIVEKENSEDGYRGHAAWLSMMRRSRIEDIKVVSSDKQYEKHYGGFDAYLYEDLNPVVNGVKVTDKRELANSAYANIKFNNGLYYDIYVNEKNLLIYASDIDTALVYDLCFESEMEQYNSYAKNQPNPRTGKPVIYLYPTKETDCVVKLDYPKFTYTYPAYENGWHVTAFPDGRLVNKKDNSEHYYLFWEGDERIDLKFNEGFCVKGEDTEKFLKEKLSFMGLNAREYNDFITYWVPKMKDSPYNLITFAKDEYEQLAPLTVIPKPDSILRIHMVYKSLKQPVSIKEQALSSFERKGFTVIEWGGTNDN